ncbi:MAG: hypothetical protein P4N41_24595 [Negativicutes bacterium]|nr:hypothetical protein [Negativicutes bacterium]MDR3592851.1 hypothetical protein [Negativicutes bacterium]
MGRFAKVAIMLCLCVLVAAFSSSWAQAAPEQAMAKPTKLVLKVAVDDPKLWEFTFLTRDGDFAKPVSIVVIWDTGSVTGDGKTEMAIAQGKLNGDVTITTERNTYVNYRVAVRGPKNVQLGSLSMQVKNIGQTEFINVSTPEFTEPKLTYGSQTDPDHVNQPNPYNR